MLESEQERLWRCGNERNEGVGVEGTQDDERSVVALSLKLRVVVMDNPSTYICRLNRTPGQFFPSTIETFASQLGSLLGLVSQVKELARQTLNVLDEVSPIQSTSYTLS
ncbi:hypothetical protein INT45_012425, partial [Circinella minor]